MGGFQQEISRDVGVACSNCSEYAANGQLSLRSFNSFAQLERELIRKEVWGGAEGSDSSLVQNQSCFYEAHNF